MKKTIFLSVFAMTILSMNSRAQTADELYKEGKTFKDQSKYQEALEKFRKATEINPDFGEAWYELGWCYNENEMYGQAITPLKKANELLKDYYKVNYELGYAHQQLDEADDAIFYFKEAMRINPENTSSYMGLGDVYKEVQSDPDEAMKWYNKVLELDNKSRKANYCIGWCYNEKDNYDEAIPYLQKAIEIDNKYTSAYTELGYSYYAKKRYDEALVPLQSALALNADSFLSRYYIGLCYIGMNKKSDAMNVYNKLKDNNSDYAGKLLDKINKM